MIYIFEIEWLKIKNKSCQENIINILKRSCKIGLVIFKKPLIILPKK